MEYYIIGTWYCVILRWYLQTLNFLKIHLHTKLNVLYRCVLVYIVVRFDIKMVLVITVLILPTYFILAMYDVCLYSIDNHKTAKTRFNIIILTQY